MITLDAPVLVGDLHLDLPLPDLNGEGRYQGARLLVRLHGRPLGEVALPLQRRVLAAGELAASVWPQIGELVREHCAEDGIAPPAALTAAGLLRSGPVRCASGPAPQGTPPVTVVIATRERTPSLLRCLDSLSLLKYPSFDVVVADSAPSTETTAEALRPGTRWPFPLRYVRARWPGLAVAHNVSLPAVTGEIVAFTDDDVEVDPDWLTALVRAFQDTGATCATGVILPAELETPAQLLVERAGGYARGFTRRVFRYGMPDPGPLFPFAAGRFGSGANMAFRTSWLLAAGGFDPATGAGTPARGGDDLAAFLSVVAAGQVLVYEPAAIVRHWHRPGYDAMRRQAYGYGVGLGAYLTASVCARPLLLGAMLRRTLPAARHLLSEASEKNAGRSASFPRDLVWRERAGVLAGPFAYAVSRWHYRRCPRPRPGLAA